MNTYITKPRKETPKAGSSYLNITPCKPGLAPVAISTITNLEEPTPKKAVSTKTKSFAKLNACEQSIETPYSETYSMYFSKPKSKNAATLTKNLFAPASIKSRSVKQV